MFCFVFYESESGTVVKITINSDKNEVKLSKILLCNVLLCFYESESGTVVKITINSGTRVRQTAALSQLSLLTRNFWSVRKAFLSVEAAHLTHKETRFKSQGMALSLAGRRQHSTKTEI